MNCYDQRQIENERKYQLEKQQKRQKEIDNIKDQYQKDMLIEKYRRMDENIDYSVKFNHKNGRYEFVYKNDKIMKEKEEIIESDDDFEEYNIKNGIYENEEDFLRMQEELMKSIKNDDYLFEQLTEKAYEEKMEELQEQYRFLIVNDEDNIKEDEKEDLLNQMTKLDERMNKQREQYENNKENDKQEDKQDKKEEQKKKPILLTENLLEEQFLKENEAILLFLHENFEQYYFNIEILQQLQNTYSYDHIINQLQQIIDSLCDVKNHQFYSVEPLFYQLFYINLEQENQLIKYDHNIDLSQNKENIIQQIKNMAEDGIKSKLQDDFTNMQQQNNDYIDFGDNQLNNKEKCTQDSFEDKYYKEMQKYLIQEQLFQITDKRETFKLLNGNNEDLDDINQFQYHFQSAIDIDYIFRYCAMFLKNLSKFYQKTIKFYETFDQDKIIYNINKFALNNTKIANFTQICEKKIRRLFFQIKIEQQWKFIDNNAISMLKFKEIDVIQQKIESLLLKKYNIVDQLKMTLITDEQCNILYINIFSEKYSINIDENCKIYQSLNKLYFKFIQGSFNNIYNINQEVVQNDKFNIIEGKKLDFINNNLFDQITDFSDFIIQNQDLIEQNRQNPIKKQYNIKTTNKQYLTKISCKKNQILCIKSNLQTGKSSNIILQNIEKNDYILSISSRQTLCYQQQEQFQISSYLDIESKEISLLKHKKVIIQYESLKRLKQYEQCNFTVIIDEFEQLLDQFKNAKKFEKNIQYLIDILQKAKKVIILDAQLQNSSITLLENICPQKQIRIVYNKYIHPKEHKQVKIQIKNKSSTDQFFIQLKNDIKDKKKVCISSSCYSFIKQVQDFCKTVNKELKIKIYHGKQNEKVESGKSMQQQKEEDLKDINKALNEQNTDILIFNSAISVGVDIVYNFDKMYSFLQKGTINPLNFIQQIGRCRNCNIINVFVENYSISNKFEELNYRSYDQIKQIKMFINYREFFMKRNFYEDTLYLLQQLFENVEIIEKKVITLEEDKKIQQENKEQLKELKKQSEFSEKEQQVQLFKQITIQEYNDFKLNKKVNINNKQIYKIMLLQFNHNNKYKHVDQEEFIKNLQKQDDKQIKEFLFQDIYLSNQQSFKTQTKEQLQVSLQLLQAQKQEYNKKRQQSTYFIDIVSKKIKSLDYSMYLDQQIEQVKQLLNKEILDKKEINDLLSLKTMEEKKQHKKTLKQILEILDINEENANVKIGCILSYKLIMSKLNTYLSNLGINCLEIHKTAQNRYYTLCYLQTVESQ